MLDDVIDEYFLDTTVINDVTLDIYISIQQKAVISQLDAIVDLGKLYDGLTTLSALYLNAFFTGYSITYAFYIGREVKAKVMGAQILE